MKQKTKKKKHFNIFMVVVMLILCLIFFFRCAYEEDVAFVSQYEQNVNRITEINYNEQQDALNFLVEEGKMNVNYSAKAIFEGKVSETFNIKNIKNNHYPIVFELFDENENCIYVSKKIEPGFEINNIKLTQELKKGLHECKMKVGYAEEGNVASVFPITIEVK